MAGIIMAGVVIVTVVVATKVFLRCRSRDNKGGVLPKIPDETSSPIITSSSSSSKAWKYDVFLSFRGEDTRKNFVDHLYSALDQHGILTYKDDVTLDRGDTIGPALLNAIRESHMALIIFSENYADSSWCLDELLHIMKCREEDSGQIVIPVFYHVDPSNVRKQSGQFGNAFAKLHKLSKNKNKIESWKKALADASSIAGWETEHVTNGHEAACIQEIVGSILHKLFSSDPTLVEDENLVGMGMRLERLKSQLRIGLGGVRMVGIWGLGGGGKTTLATSLYKKFSPNFDGCCFLGNIREETKQHGLQCLQEKILSTVFGKQMQVESVELGKDKIKQMLCHRKVLIILDDVDHLNQLEALAGSHKWFGDGSRIVITTRNQQLLIAHRVDEVSPISLLSREEAVRLFRRHAYHEDNVVQDYEKLTLHVIYYVNGLPLALKILGAFLYGKNKDEWISTLARLKDHPEMDIVEILKISYDGLTPLEKELFLDIACFYRGEKKDDVMEILDACDFYPAIGIKVLIQKALITVSLEGCFDMHDLVQDMGHYIVRGKHINNPEKHSRLWRKQDIQDICSKNATTENDKIEAIKCDVRSGCLLSFIMLVSKMRKLRFIQVTSCLDEGEDNSSSAIMESDNIECPDIERHVRQNHGCLSSLIMLVSKRKKLTTCFNKRDEDRYSGSATMKNDNSKMGKPRFPQVITTTFDEGSRFLSKELRYIHWDGYPASLFPESFQPRKLVVLKLQRSLQHEIWKGCKYLPCLKELELSWMESLERTPDFGGLPCLQKLKLDGCENLEEIHQSLGNHNTLVSLIVRECKKLRRFPTVVRMENLEIFEISNCNALVMTPDFGGLPCLQKLKLDGCENLEELHQSLGNHNSLVYLRLKHCYKLSRFPTIVGMDKLEILKISRCEALVEFPKIEAKMGSLVELYLESVGIEILPSSVGEYCTNLISLTLGWCDKLKSIEGNFHALKRLENFILRGCEQFNIQQLILPRCLRKLDLSWRQYGDGEIPKDVGELSSLRELHLSRSQYSRLNFGLSRLTSLKLLDLCDCEKLVELPELPSSLAILKADRCYSLEAVVRDDSPINCKCLCDVSIKGGKTDPIGGERLIETMFQGISVESRCINLQLYGLQILRVFGPGVVRGGSCRMLLPENWYNLFSGFLFFTASFYHHCTIIHMTHKKLEGGSTEIEGGGVVNWPDDEESEGKGTWVGYIPFGSLRNTLWWQDHQTSTAIQIEFPSLSIRWCGCYLMPNRSEATTISNSEVYTCGLNITRDSNSTLECDMTRIF